MSIRPDGKTIHELTVLDQISEVDQLLIGDASEPLKSKRFSFAGIRAALGGGSPVIDDLPEEATTTPEWRVDGSIGSWIITITGYIAGVSYYLIYYYSDDTESFVAYNILYENRSVPQDNALMLEIPAPATTPPTASYRRFKIQPVTPTSQGTISTELAAWSLISIPATYVFPLPPTLSATGGYPLVSCVESGSGDHKYIVSVRINAPVDGNGVTQKNYVKEYILERAYHPTAEWPAAIPWIQLSSHAISTSPPPAAVVYNTEGLYKAGGYLKFRVKAKDLNGKESPLTNPYSATQTVQIAKDTTAPDPPVMSFVNTPLVIVIMFAPPTQNAGTTDCLDLDYFSLEVSIDAGAWGTPIKVPAAGTGGVPSHLYSVATANINKNFNFRAKAIDREGNASAYCAESSNKTVPKIESAHITDGAITPAKANLSLQGWQFSGLFSATDHNTVAWSSGTLTTGDGTTYSIVSGNTGNITALTWIYFDLAASVTVLQTTTTAANAVGTGKILMAVCQNVASGKLCTFQAFGGSGGQGILVVAANIAANTITANEIAANTITANEIAANTITTAQLNFTPGTGDVMSGSIIATIRASGESLVIQANKLDINASTDFIAAKLAKVGGTYDSAASGARVRIFPDANTGIQITDGTDDVFKALVGGTDVGDVIIGSAAGQFLKWDKSAGTLLINGILSTSGGLVSGPSFPCIKFGKWGGTDAITFYAVDESAQGFYAGDEIRIGPSSGGRVEITPSLISVYGGDYSAFHVATQGSLGVSFFVQGSSGGKMLTINNLDDNTITANRNLNIAGSSVLKIGGTTVLSGQMTAQTTLEGVITQLKAVNLMAA